LESLKFALQILCADRESNIARLTEGAVLRVTWRI